MRRPAAGRRWQPGRRNSPTRTREVSCADLLGRVDLTFNLVCRRGLDLRLAAGLSSKSWQVSQDGGSGTVALQQVKECDWADAARTREPQPVRPLSPRERLPFHPALSGGGASFFFAPIFGSVPLSMRRMLARWRQKIITTSAVMISIAKES